jgi:cell wall-associated NlpC family hydrolase
MDILSLKTLLGQEYYDYDAEGNYIGCFAPVSFLWPQLPRYAPPDCLDDYFGSAFGALLDEFERIDEGWLKPTDIVVLRPPRGYLHVGVYLGQNEILHVQRGGRVEITRLSRLSHRIFAFLRRNLAPSR